MILNLAPGAFHYSINFLLDFASITSQLTYFLLPHNHKNLTEVFSFHHVLSAFMKQQYCDFELKMTLEKQSKYLQDNCIFKINLIGSNLHTHNAIFPQFSLFDVLVFST